MASRVSSKALERPQSSLSESHQDLRLNDDLSTEYAQLQAICDPRNPFNWPTRKKWTITLVAVFATFTTIINGTILTVAHDEIDKAFHISEVSFPHSYWPVTSWTLGGAVFSLIVLPIFEDFGIRPGFLGTYVVFICLIIPQALASNFATLIIVRFGAGGCVSILANTAASVISNVWEGERARTIPLSLYIASYLAGISIGPVIGAVIIQHLSWRWISYLQLIWYSSFFPIYFFLLEESRGSIILERIAASHLVAHKETKRDWNRLLRKMGKSVERPLIMLFTEPVLFVFTLWSAFAVGTVYLFTQSIEQVFVGLYGWTPSQAGYIQTAVVIGICLGWNSTMLSKKLYFASAQYNEETPGTPVPEARLYMSTIGSLVGVTGGMFVYGWTSYPDIPWIAPAIGLAMVGFGIVIVVLAAADYIVDAYAKYAGSAVAALLLGENIVAAFLPLAAQSMYTGLGFQWASTVIGCVSLALSFAPVVLIKWGRRIRARSPYMEKSLVDDGVTGVP